MAGFEVIVRPMVVPNIRPTPSRSLPPAGDATQGQCVMGGSSGQVVALTHSYSASASSSGGTETTRTYDVARIRPAGSGGATRAADSSSDVYIDVEVLKKVQLRNGGDSSVYHYTPIEESDNIEIILRDQTRNTS